jgi:hypothetical protein
MAKKLVYNYTFTPGGAGSGTIEMDGKWVERSLLLITNVTDNVIIYNFAGSGLGGTTSYTNSTHKTVLTLDYDTSSMSASDELQIFVDQEHDEIEFGESFVDPVHKLRVSTPENLIDTDFEYGLQSSKWETLELVNNIPSIYSLNGGISIGGIANVNTIANTQLVQVICSVPHELSIGDPIEVQGLTSRTAQGKYLVTNVESTLIFSYKAVANQAATEDVRTAYTTIIPGTFFSASDIEYDRNESIETDNANPSTLTVTTDYYHGLTTSTSVYITNTVGKRAYTTVSNFASTAPDGDTYQRNSDDSFYLPDHKLYTNQRIYVTPDTSTNPSASLPSVDQTPPEPGQSSSGVSLAYEGIKAALDNIQTTMGNDVSRWYMGYQANSNYAYYWAGFYSVRSTDTSDTSYQYSIYGDYGFNNSFYHYISGSNGYANYRWPGLFGEGNTLLYTGQPIDVGNFYQKYSWGGDGNDSPSTLGNLGLWTIWTPHEPNQYTPYMIKVQSRPSPEALAGNASFFIQSQFNYDYYTKRWYNNTTVQTDTPSGRFSLGNNWYYSYGVVYSYPSANYNGHYKMDLWIENDLWDGQYSTNGRFYTRNYSGIPLWLGESYSKGSGFRVEVLLPIDDDANAANYGSTGTVLTNAQIAQQIAQSVVDYFTPPSFNNSVGINTLYAGIINSNRITLRNELGADYQYVGYGTGPWNIETDQTANVVDDYYDVTGVTNTTISIGSSNQIAPRILEIESTTGIQTYNNTVYLYYPGGHGLSDGQKVTFNVTSGNAPTGITNGNTYYAITADDEYFGLADSVNDWTAGINAITDPARPASNAEYEVSIPSIAGRVAAAGTIGVTTTSTKLITGYGTKFRSTYKNGDDFVIRGTGTPANYLFNNVASVVSDTILELVNAVGIVTDNARHFVDTKVNLRADGTFLHRPFDGGVEITAGTSPDSQIVRQTRKYFRYQSGKGIQCSVAINFNPSRPVRLTSGSGSTITMTTEYPHGLRVGNTIRVTGAEEPALYTPSNATYNPNTGDLVLTINSHGFLVGEEISLAEESLTFTCDKDSNATNHTYPRSTDPAGGNARLEIRSVTTNTITVYVGTSSYAGNHSFVSAATDAVTHHDISNNYNGSYEITSVTDFTFTYTGGGSVSVANPEGFVEYAISGYKNAGVRCGLFDFQNGFFYEYDGKQLFAVRRSSVQQLSGTCLTTKNSNIISGETCRFQDQLKVGDMIVIRGQSYKVTRISSQTEINVQPKYRGSSQRGVVITRTVDTRVPQRDWNIDVADGSGPSGFTLNINNIQMAYFDYSWYGAGKIRFGFKDTKGRVRYCHEFVHNNILNEAYMRSGNIPARYEVFNKGIPTFVPSLFHWGTSVIMDGTFDNDDSYLFTASGNSLTFTNGSSSSAVTTGAGSIYRQRVYGSYSNYYLRIPFGSADASKFSAGIPLYTEDEELNGDTVSFAQYSGSTFYVYIFLSAGYSQPAIYPTVASGATVSIGAPATGGVAADLNSLIPLISVRLSPSVDNSLIGAVGDRDIINRMQLKMKELGVSVSHDSTITVVLNGNISNVEYENVGSPSLSQYVSHTAGDSVNGGTVIYSFRASGGTESANGKRFSQSSEFSLDGLTDLGNSILGGDDVFPNGPDILTICATPVDSSEIDQTSAYQVSSRLSWSESQA